jgi:E3 ubiquitin-protein ligase RNF14
VPSEQPKDGEPFVLQVSVQLSEPRPVLIVNEDNPEATQSVTVSHLPPLLINLLLPPAYPLDHPPTIHSIQPSHAWLPPPLIEHLTRILLDMWDNQCVLDLWVERIQDGDQFFSALDLFHLDPKYIR